MSYSVLRAPEFVLPILNAPFDADHVPAPFDAAQCAPIALYPWPDSGFHPPAFARVMWHEDGLLVLMYAREEEPRAQVTQTGGAVCRDSCLEFFFDNGAGGPYLNLEMNPRGVYHLGLGSGRAGRTVFFEPPLGVDVCAAAPGGPWWAVAARLSSAFLAQTAGISLKQGACLKGNFYKCGDDTPHPHWGSYYPVHTEKTDYHRPECFGDLCLI